MRDLKEELEMYHNEIIPSYMARELFGITEESDDLLGIKVKYSNQTIEHRDYKDKNKLILTNKTE